MNFNLLRVLYLVLVSLICLTSLSPVFAAPAVHFSLENGPFYHNPNTGRFWNMDSFEGNGSDPSSLHKYTYCGNNPANSYDPSGHFSIGEFEFAGAIGLQARVLFAGLSGTIGGVINSLDTAIASHFTANAGDLGSAFATGYKAGFAFGLVATWAPGTVAVIGSGLGGISVGQAINDGNPALIVFRTLTLGAGIYGSGKLTRALTDLLGGKTRAWNDPGVAPLVRAIQNKYPGRVVKVGRIKPHSNGKEYEVDIELDNCIIEVKSRAAGSGLVGQIITRQDPVLNPTGKPVIGYSVAPMETGVAKAISNSGGIPADGPHMADLIDAISPDKIAPAPPEPPVILLPNADPEDEN